MNTRDTTMQTPDTLIHDHSRQQLSALMDGALPADETRFLLRRLQHDAELSAHWGRWRLAGETMRGLAPGQCLPADFPARVMACIQAECGQPVATPAQTPSAVRARSYWRWGGGAAVAASLAMTMLMLRQPDAPADVAVPAQVAAVQTATQAVPSAVVPVRATAAHAPAAAEAGASLIAAAAVAVPQRRRDAEATARRASPAPLAAAHVAGHATTLADAAPPMPALTDPFSPPSDAAVRPWPRSLLPELQGAAGLTVGLGQLPASGQGSPFAPPQGPVEPPGAAASEPSGDQP